MPSPLLLGEHASSVQALSNDAAFVRVRKGVYALRALAGNVGPVPHNTPKSSRPPLGRGLDNRDSYRSAPMPILLVQSV